jgi:hypothetical protein
MPDKVNYADPCGALCRHENSTSTFRMQAQLKQALVKLVRAGSPRNQLAKGAAADLVVAVETYIHTNGAQSPTTFDLMLISYSVVAVTETLTPGNIAFHISFLESRNQQQ